MAQAVERHPDRFLYQPNLSPIKQRGVRNAIWELEYWVKDKGARIFKFYPPEDTYINDPELWPFFGSLGIDVVKFTRFRGRVVRVGGEG